MARTAIVPTALTRNTGTTAVTTTIDSTLVTNGVQVDLSGIAGDRLLIRVTNTHGTAHDVTLNSGSYSAGAVGDIVTEIALTSGVTLFTIEPQRVMDDDGLLTIDFASGHTGVIEVYTMPR
jgi:hypothetical protein